MQLFPIPQPLLAADFTQIAIALIVIFFAVVKKLFEASNESAKKAAARPQRPPNAGPVAAKPAQAGGQQADPLRSQVEEFLRRASHPPQAEPQPQPSRPELTEIAIEEVTTTPERRRAVEAPRRPDSETRTIAAPLPRARRQRKRQTVAEHVAERVAAHTETLGQQASRLGQRIVEEDQQFDVQLRAKFDHTVGTLVGQTEDLAPAQPATASADSPARQIAEMLANPQGVRQAVLLNEILRRPNERWGPPG